MFKIEINQSIKKYIFISSIVLLILFILLIFYMILVYFEFLSNKESIFAKINEFSKVLEKNDFTDITLGVENEVIKDNKSTIFYDRNNKIITQYSPQRHILIPLRQIPFFLTRGFLLIEDKQFYSHGGFNFLRISNAVIQNIISFGHSPGGSTISQQLAKILFTKQKRNLKRKIYELYCTLELEKRFTKNQILQIYLNSIYLGHGIYGIANASQFYFDKDASNLTIAEAALLIGMNRSPENYSPIKNQDNAKRVQKVVLNKFVKEKYLTKEESKFEFNRFWKRFYLYGKASQSFWHTDINNSGYVTEYIRQILEKEFDYNKITEGGIIVETTIDIEKQNLAEQVVKEQLKYIRNKFQKIVKDNKLTGYTDDDLNNIEASFTSIDYNTGEVLVLVGGYGYSFANQFNRAINAYRPIGSSVKPFIYSKALEQKKLGGKDIHPFSKYKDEIKTYLVNGKIYNPRNYHFNHKYGNMVTIYDAIKTSLNTVSVQIFNDMDKKIVADLIREAACLNTDEDKKRVPEVLSLALGTCELSTYELASAYSLFCRAGKSLHPVVIKKIYDTNGYVYYDYTRENNPFFNDLYPKEYRETKELIKPEVTYELVQIMRAVFEKGGTGYWASYVTGLNVPAYGKSGTTQDLKDGWFAGFTDKEVSACWVGLDNNKSIQMSGATTAELIWCDYNNKVASSISNPIEIPSNMKLLTIDIDTGLIATKNCTNTRDFYFWNDGPIPEACYIHGELNKLELDVSGD